MRSVLPNFMEMIRAVSFSYTVKRRYAGDMKACMHVCTHSKGYSTWPVSVRACISLSACLQ